MVTAKLNDSMNDSLFALPAAAMMLLLSACSSDIYDAGMENRSPESLRLLSVLVEEWNEALVNRDFLALEELYAEDVFVYGDLRTNQEVVSLKRKSLKADEMWVQQIQGPIRTSRVPQIKPGLVKAEFLKVSGSESDMDTVLAYLVFEETESTWRIVQESDFSTDLVLLKRRARNQQAENEPTIEVEEPTQEAGIDLDWYGNGRFGWSFFYPSFFEPQGESTNGDGQKFRYEDLEIVAHFDWDTRCDVENQPCAAFLNRVQFQSDTLANGTIVFTKKVSTSTNGMVLQLKYPLSKSSLLQEYIDLLSDDLGWGLLTHYNDSIITVSNN